MKTFRTILTPIVCAFFMCALSYEYGRERGEREGRESIGEPCWGDVLMEDYVLDVVDETNFWEVCDSTAFSQYEENTSEWYLAVCLEFARIYK